MIAHRLSTVRHADKILVLNRGELVEQGTHEELMQVPGLYRQLWEAQTTERRREGAPAPVASNGRVTHADHRPVAKPAGSVAPVEPPVAELAALPRYTLKRAARDAGIAVSGAKALIAERLYRAGFRAGKVGDVPAPILVEGSESRADGPPTIEELADEVSSA